MGLLAGHYFLQGHQHKLELADSRGYDTCKQASEMASRFFVTVRHWQY
jgi:hypothetical protein